MIYDLWYDMISYTYLHQSDWIGVYGLCIPVAHLISRFGETVSGQNHISSFCSVASNFDHSVHNVFESSQMRWSEHVTNLTKAYPREGCVLDHLAVNSDVRAINTPSIVASHTSCWCWSLAKHTCTQRHTHTHIHHQVHLSNDFQESCSVVVIPFQSKKKKWLELPWLRPKVKAEKREDEVSLVLRDS